MRSHIGKAHCNGSDLSALLGGGVTFLCMRPSIDKRLRENKVHGERSQRMFRPGTLSEARFQRSHPPTPMPIQLYGTRRATLDIASRKYAGHPHEQVVAACSVPICSEYENSGKRSRTKILLYSAHAGDITFPLPHRPPNVVLSCPLQRALEE